MIIIIIIRIITLIIIYFLPWSGDSESKYIAVPVVKQATYLEDICFRNLGTRWR
jgi:hypothetical protein